MGKNMKNLKKNLKNFFFHSKKGEIDQKLCEESKKVGPNALRLVLFEKIGLLKKNCQEKVCNKIGIMKKKSQSHLFQLNVYNN